MSAVMLHVHTDRSILDGGAKVAGYAERAAELSQPALSVTDHGTLAASFELVKQCAIYGIRPIIGLEAYVAPLDRTNKNPVFFGSKEQKEADVSGGGKYLHLTLLARSSEGVRNLFRLQHDAYLNGFYGKPRIDYPSLEAHSGGLICLTGCLGSHLQTFLRLGQTERAKDWLGDLKEVFGKERLFVEVMDHGLPEERDNLPKLYELAAQFNLLTVATPDCHYCLAGDKHPHDVLLCLQTKAKLSDAKRFRFNGEGYHLPSAAEMLASGWLTTDSVRNTLRVADSVQEYTGIFDTQLKLPKLPDVEDEVGELRRQVLGGLQAQGASTEHYTQCEHELSVISGSGFAGYFLVLQRAMALGRERGIRFGPARGSAAGATTAWALRISQVDPLEHGLMFERFLNSERIGMPDIDIDIQDDCRPEFVQMVRDYFGNEYAAQAGQYGTIGAKSAIKDAIRVSGGTYLRGEALCAKLPPPRFGRAPSLADLPESVREANRDVLDVAERIEGLVRSAGIHPSAMVISPVPLTDIIPTKFPGGKTEYVTEFTGAELEKLGLVKYDFLGLRTLSIIDECLRFIEKRIGHAAALPEGFSDSEVYKLLSAGDTTGVFQCESPGMRKLLRHVRPKSLVDVASVLALYRPGPMGVGSHKEYADRKNGRSPIRFPHPELESALSGPLSETYGVIVFQEQVLKVLAAVGGYTYGTAELIFNAMRKKDTAAMEAARPDFESRLHVAGFSEAAISALWETLVPFADYSFNKSHSVSYAILTYWTAWLKAHYPAEFWASILTFEKDTATLHAYLKELEEVADIPVLAPDINESGISFTVHNGNSIRYGVGSIHGISANSFSKIKGNGPYRTMREWWEKCPKVALSSAVLAPLIKAGCFDSLEPDREALFAEHTDIAARATEYRQSKKLFQSYDILFHASVSVPQRQQWELEVLGTELTKQVTKLKATRWLTPSEWFYVAKTFAEYPGRSPVSLNLGPFTTLQRYVTITPEPRLFTSLRLVGIERDDYR